MKLTCPGCSARYTIADERIGGRRAKIRCKRCGETIFVDASASGASAASGETYAEVAPGVARIRDEGRRAPTADLFAGVAAAGGEGSVLATPTPTPTPTPMPTPTEPPRTEPALIGERNENSVLFSLAGLSAPQSSAVSSPASSPRPSAAESSTESSALIDIRAMCGDGASSSASSSRIDEIANLTGGGAFAQLLAPPLLATSFDSSPPPAEPVGGRNRRSALVVGALALGIAVIGVTVSVASSRSASAPNAASAASSALTASAGAPIAIGTAALSAGPAGTTPSSPASASTASAAARPARVAIHASPTPAPGPTMIGAPAATGAAAATATATATAKCCPGENETTCHMRLAVGAACGDAPATAIGSSAPPFDRLAATRALDISVASCKRVDGPTGPGHVRVTYQPSGAASAVEVAPPYDGTVVGACVAKRYRSVSVPAFSGGALAVGKTFTIE